MSEKMISVKPAQHAKLKRVMKIGRFGTLRNALDSVLDDYINHHTPPAPCGVEGVSTSQPGGKSPAGNENQPVAA